MSRLFDALRRTDTSDIEERFDLDSGVKGVSADPRCAERITVAPRPESRLMDMCADSQAVREKFRFVDHRLRSLRKSRPMSTLLVTSAVPREGKTVVSINIALTLAACGDRVLLVDADMRRPGLGPALGLPPATPGLVEYLQGERELGGSIVYIENLKIHHLPAGVAGHAPSELLQNPRLREMTATAAAEFQWVVIDSPPLVPFTDAHALAAVADGALLVVRSGMSRGEDLDRGIAALEGTFIAGIVLNGYDAPNQDAYYSYYDSKGKRR